MKRKQQQKTNCTGSKTKYLKEKICSIYAPGQKGQFKHSGNWYIYSFNAFKKNYKNINKFYQAIISLMLVLLVVQKTFKYENIQRK